MHPINPVSTPSLIRHALAETGPVVTTLREAFPHAFAIYAFGSRVTDDAGPESDLDLAVLVAGYADPLRLWNLAGALADVVGCHVDLLDLRAASTVMQYQILQNGRLLWAVQPEADLFECFVLNEKLGLDAARQPLLDNIAREGKIYGG